jgi:ribulose-phosphate 3-epimerase
MGAAIRNNVRLANCRSVRYAAAMQRSPQVAPSVFGADFGHLADDIAAVTGGSADLLHVDVMDGRFVPNITFGPVVLRHLRALTHLPLDVHLMVFEPERHLHAVAQAGADIITVHCEATVHLQRTLSDIRALGKRAGVALNPSTPASALEYVLPDVDLILVMTVNPGFLGQSCLRHIVPKIAQVRQMVQASGLDIRVEVDGGINPETAPLVVRAGADILVAGAAVFDTPDRAAAIARLRAAAQSP